MKKIALSILALATAFGASSAAASGTLDPGFGDGGVKTMQLKTVIPSLETVAEEGVAYDVLIDQRGRTVVVGEVLDKAPDGSENNFYRGLIARYLKNGELDPAFNEGLPVAHEAGPRGFGFSNVVELPDGRLIVAGTTYDKLNAVYQQNLPVVCRYLEEGGIDATFGDGGCRTVEIVAQGPGLRRIKGFEGGNGLRVLPDGKIILMGNVGQQEPDDPRSFAVVRLDADGQDDMSFGGVDCPSPAPRCGIAFSPSKVADKINPRVVAASPVDGRVVVAGIAMLQGFEVIYTLRFSSDGSSAEEFELLTLAELVGTFPQFTLQAMELLSDGSAILAGRAWGPKNNGAFIAKFDPAGNLDPMFATKGQELLNGISGNTATEVTALAVQRDGKLLIGGTEIPLSNDVGLPGSWFRAWRLDPVSGMLDERFGLNGMAMLADFVSGKDHQPYGIAVDERNAVMAGSVYTATVQDGEEGPSWRPIMMRFELDELFSDEFDE